MAEEKKAEKYGFHHLAEYTNGRNWPNPDQVDLHSRALVSVHLIWIRPISPCNCLAKTGLQGSVENCYSFQEKSRVLNEFKVFDIFRNIGRIYSFRPFESFGHLIIRPDFFRPFFFGHLNFGLKHLYPHIHSKKY
jgi:hypothetical protein